MRRCISWVRPPSCALSRDVRVRVARGSIAYSAVIHPSPLPRFQPGTPSSTDAVHSTRVAPNVIRHEPSAYGATARSIVIGRSSDAERPWRMALSCFTELPDDGGRGLAGRERNDDNTPSPGFYFSGADNRGFPVVGALHYHVRLESLDQLERRLLGEYYDEIDAFEGTEDESALRGAAYRPTRTLEPVDGVIAIDADNQGIGRSSRRDKKVDVSRMQQIEDSVGERYLILSFSSPTLRLRPCRYFRRRVTRPQSLLIARGWKWMTRSFFNGSLITSS